MSFVGLSPSDTKLLVGLYKLYKEARDAPERFRTAQRYLKAAKAVSADVRKVCTAISPPSNEDVLGPQLEVLDGAVRGLEEHLEHYSSGLSQQSRLPKTVLRRLDWAVNELYGKVAKLQDATTAAFGLVNRAVATRTMRQVNDIHGQTFTAVMAKSIESVAENTAQLNPADDIHLQSRLGCLCRCHATNEYSRQFTSLVITGMDYFSRNCDCSCARGYAIKARLALSQLGIPWAITIALSLQYSSAGMHIYPSLETHSIRKYTSPGFLLLAELEHDTCYEASDLANACNAEQRQAIHRTALRQKVADIQRLFKVGEVSINDVDPLGVGWFQKLLRCPWSPGRRDAQSKLLRYLVSCSREAFKRDPKLLYHVATWIGEGPHLDMLDCVLELGLEPGALDATYFQKWPAFSNPNWLDETIIPDPFGIDFLRQCLQKEPEFAGCDLLTTYLLTGSTTDFEAAFSRSRVQAHSNVLGQTAVHLAVLLPARLKRLIDFGMPVNGVDRGGTTPLMYAAAYGQFDSIIMLIEAGADPSLRDRLNNRLFIDYAVRMGYIDLIGKFAGYLRGTNDSQSALRILDRSLQYYLVNGPDRCEGELLESILKFGADPDTPLLDQDGSRCTSMHLINNSNEGLILLDHGFSSIAVQDGDGVTPLMNAVRFSSAVLVERLLKLEKWEGVSINICDKSGWTALMRLIARPKYYGRDSLSDPFQANKKAAITGSINLLLRRGAVTFHRDSCGCICSPHGCSAVSIALNHAANAARGFPFGSLGDDTTLLDLCLGLSGLSRHSYIAAIEDVTAFTKAMKSGIAHTCCSKNRIRNESLALLSAGQTSADHIALEDGSTQSGEDDDLVSSLAQQVACFYHHVNRLAKIEHDQYLARSAEYELKFGPEKPKSVWYVDKHNDTYGTVIHGPYCRPRGSRLDLDAYDRWIEWCVNRRQELYISTTLERWSQNALAFTAKMREELSRLDRGESEV